MPRTNISVDYEISPSSPKKKPAAKATPKVSTAGVADPHSISPAKSSPKTSASPKKQRYGDKNNERTMG